MLISAALAACGDGGPAQSPSQVPARWREVRDLPGHVRHLDTKARCADCHVAGRYEEVDPARCESCHAGSTRELHARSTNTATRAPACYDCHAFARPTPPPDDCERCHARPQGEARAIQVHHEPPCGTCHDVHRAGPTRGEQCVRCHEQPAVHGELQGADRCEVCHPPHERGRGARTSCEPCHAKEEPRVTRAASIRGHKGCVDCHQPHAKDGSGVKTCEACHPKVRPVHGGQDRCTDCHPPHLDPRAQTAPAAAPCERCHGSATAHAPRAPEAPPGPPVLSAAASPGARPSPRCQECHQPHGFTLRTTPALCQRCHAERRDPRPGPQAMHWPKGHEDCALCHPRAGHEADIKPPPCERCHAAVKAKAAPGHQGCKDCHGLHGSTLGAKTCAECHAPQVTSPHQIELAKARGVPAANTCGECHDRHQARASSTCVSCHPEAPSLGQHQVGGHGRCEACHGVHRAAAPDVRSACLTCHPGQVDHEPKAVRCGGCHPFRRPEP